MQSIRLQRKSHQNAQLYLTTRRYSTADVESLTDIVVEAVAVVGRRAAYMKNTTDTVVEVAAVVGEVVTVMAAVLILHVVAAKHQRKEESSLV